MSSLEDIFTAAIHLYEEQYIMVLVVPNVFIQTKIPLNKDGEERVIMKIACVLVDVLVKLDSEMYRNHVVFENVKKVIYVVLLRSIYGILVVALLFYNKFHGDLENIGFEYNIYDPCVANRIKF